MRHARRPVLALLGAAAWWLLSCRDIPAPDDGVAAVSPIQLPLPGVVAGDTMRDSLGVVAPIQFIAYGTNGQPLSPQPAISFIVLDTGAHVAGALLIGDSIGARVRIVGAVGSLQTSPDTVKVTTSPDTLVQNDSIVHHKSYSVVTGDSVALSADLAVVVQHRGTTNTGVEAVIVQYTLDRVPTGNGSGPTVVLVNGSRISTRDTTDASGRAARVARLRLVAMSSFTSDTVLVSATASYRGRVLGTVPFAIIYTRQP
jgi:hypothetical protein